MIVGSILIVTARAEHIPKTCIVIGLSSLNGSDIIFFLLFDKSGSDVNNQLRPTESYYDNQINLQNEDFRY